MEACPVSAALFDRLERITQRLSAEAPAVRDPAHLPASDECIDEETLLRLADDRLGAAARRRVEEHALGCERCLLLILRHLRTTASIDAGGFPEIPAAVRERKEIRVLVHAQEREATEETLGVIHIDLATERAVTETIAGGGLSLRLLLTPLPGARARLEARLKSGLRPEAGREVVLADERTRRKVFTGTTNRQGYCAVARLPVGAYLLHLSGRSLKARIQIEE